MTELAQWGGFSAKKKFRLCAAEPPEDLIFLCCEGDCTMHYVGNTIHILAQLPNAVVNLMGRNMEAIWKVLYKPSLHLTEVKGMNFI